MRRFTVALPLLMVAADAIAAQSCPPRVFQPPPVALSVRLEACDYLGILADPADASTNCQAMLKRVSGNAGSRVHVLERQLADTLRGVFSRHFGFLDWHSTAEPGGWKLDLRLRQPLGRGTPPAIDVVLRRGSDTSAVSEPFRFEEFELVDLLRHEAAPATRDRWLTEIEALLQRDQALNRKKMIASVFRRVPMENLLVDATADNTEVAAKIKMSDRDIRVAAGQRPTFRWEVDSMVHVTDTTIERGLFMIGKCVSRADQTYKCRMLELTYGQDTLKQDRLVSFFRESQLRPPRRVFIFDYEPAKAECAFNGVPGQ